MDYLTFTTIHTMIVISWCGVIYLGKQCYSFIKWIAKWTLKELEEETTFSKNGLSGRGIGHFFISSFPPTENHVTVMYRYIGLIRK